MTLEPTSKTTQPTAPQILPHTAVAIVFSAVVVIVVAVVVVVVVIVAVVAVDMQMTRTITIVLQSFSQDNCEAPISRGLRERSCKTSIRACLEKTILKQLPLPS